MIDSGIRMLNYYPEVVKRIYEFQATTFAEGIEVDSIKTEIEEAVNDAWLLTMGEERISQWEKILNLTPKANESVEDRREKVIAAIRSNNKLNTTLINLIVSTFTGSTAISYIENSCLYVKINAPAGNKQYIFANVENALKPLVPAHLGLNVSRNYATWGDIKDDFTDWSDVSTSFATWDDVKFYVAPQE